VKRTLFAFALLLLAAGAALAGMGNKYDAIAYSAKTADFTLVSGPVYLGGWSLREAAASAAVATVIIRDGADTDTGTGGVQCAASGGVTQVGGRALAYIELPGNGSAGENYAQPINAPNGLCADVVAGEVDITIYLER
jgi:hypothetical protein